MNERERWQALHTTLKAARSAVERGDTTAALNAVNAALELDPNFLAAQTLRDRIVAGDLVIPAPPPLAARSQASDDVADPPVVAPATPVGSPDDYAKFEQRAKRRRVDRRVDAARQAIEKKRLNQAAAALDEVIELDPNLPELRELTAQFDVLRRSAATSPHRGPWVVAAAVFAASVFGASWLRESSTLLSRSMVGATQLLAAPTPAVSVSPDVEPVATSGVTPPMPPPPPSTSAGTVPAIVTAPPPEIRTVAASGPTRSAPEEIVDAVAIPPSPPQTPPVVLAPQRPVQESTVSAPVTSPVPPKTEEVDEHAMVRQTLQRYRSAYEGLDAQSAHAVWPAVNQVALARAFDGLESQTLTFDACDVKVRGEAAIATCQGSARYVPKIGSRQPHIEPRVWNFTLHKAGADWKIDSARADR